LDNYNFTISSRNSGFSSTRNIVQRGDTFRIQHSVSVSAFATVDKNAFQKPRRHHIAKRCG
jgi:hypothetical protein